MTIISVIIPVYNVESYIVKTLKSVQMQTFVDYEVIIVDDGSNDKTYEVCSEFIQNDGRFQIIKKENGGVSSARNIGLKLSKGEYIVFVDGDDVVERDYLSVLYNLITEETIDMGICGMKISNKSAIRSTTDIPEGILDRTVTARGLYCRESFRGFLFNKIFKKRIIQENDICLNENAYMCEDALFCTEYVKYIRYSRFCNIPLYEYVQREDSATNKKFNINRFSVIRTYKIIIELALFFQDQVVETELFANYLGHNIRMFKMLFLKRKKYELEWEELRRSFKNMEGVFENDRIKVKEKIAFLIIKLVMIL